MEKNGKKGLLHQPSCQDAIFVGLCSAGLLIYSLYHHYFDKNTSEWKMSPYLFPTLLSVFGLLLTLSLVADALNEMRQAEQKEESSSKKNLIGVLVMVAAALVYYILMPIISFIPATLLFLVSLFIYLGEHKWWKLILLSGVTTAAIYVLFGIALNVRLP